ncbi:type 1 glutamine amidotransferase [Alcanivorax sp. S6407]|uniref:type 1 glutamine amidotransferase n=1 Tax=Alcanivorax sp. S6407 TaxID=2926424 RepID=UPI001FF338E4|nr:type 1 glutamine amidotransferase [Alcanivorax sp. S6407]MCK0154047.1 type 1 glutamine amidotransferase [Alcanivorax sp. S6407]
MRIHYLSHVPFEQLGAMEAWFVQRDMEIRHSLLFQGDPLPALDDFDVLVVMGGPMGADDDAQFPWMAAEKALIKACIGAGKKVLGVCLGAQLIARVLGAEVTANAEKEVGWFPVHPTTAGLQDSIGKLFAPQATVLHWHGDTFAIPNGAVHLLESRGCANQAFRYGDHVLALQFHLELEADNAAALCDACPEDLAEGEWVEDKHRLLGNGQRFDDARNLLGRVLAQFIG